MKVIKLNHRLLKEFAQGSYVDSPIYFDSNFLLRYINWYKLDRLMHLWKGPRNVSVLDFGCGNGVLLPTLAEGFREVYGIDIHISAAKKIRDHFGYRNLNLLKADGNRLPFPGHSFDLVIAASVLEHFRDVTQPLREIYRVLKNGGTLLFLSPSENIFYEIGRLLFCYTKPLDHFHSADEIVKVIGLFFDIESIKLNPLPIFQSVAMYKMAVCRKMGHEI